MLNKKKKMKLWHNNNSNKYQKDLWIKIPKELNESKADVRSLIHTNEFRIYRQIAVKLDILRMKKKSFFLFILLVVPFFACDLLLFQILTIISYGVHYISHMKWTQKKTSMKRMFQDIYKIECVFFGLQEPKLSCKFARKYYVWLMVSAVTKGVFQFFGSKKKWFFFSLCIWVLYFVFDKKMLFSSVVVE